VGVLVSVASVLVACRRDTVRVSFRPPVGATYRYEVRVHSETTTRLTGRAPDVAVEDLVLRADQRVVSTAAGQVRVEVRLHQEGAPERTFVVRLDRAAQLAGVDAVEGLPPSVVGPDALPEILPGAPGAPPDRPLFPGERWSIDSRAGLPGAPQARVVGAGRLVELGLLDGRKVASTRSHTSLPLASTASLRGTAVALDGRETTDGFATRDLEDGSIERSTTLTRGEFGLTLSPAGGDQVPSLGGTLSISVRSSTRRLRD
jgi:hypothetical protein